MMDNKFQILDNGEIEVQISPVGKFNGSNSKGEAVSENITQESLNLLADKLNSSGKEVLVDTDHASVRAGLDRDTKAMGWLSSFWTTVKGLFAKMKLTSKGKELVEGREYRFLSPVFSLNQKGEPEDLHSVAFTNTPAFAGSINPIVNHAAVLTNTSEDKGMIQMEITKDELVSLIKDTVIAMNTAPAKVEEEKTEETTACNAETTETKEETACNACGDETKNEAPVEETKVEETKVEETETKEEVKEEEPEEKKEEVIKIEALNTSPVVGTDISGKSAWQNLHGEEFFKYLREHPEVR